MKSELLQRIITSLILLPAVIYVTVYSGIYLIIFLSVFYLLCLYEIIKNSKNLIFSLFSCIFLILPFYSFYFLRGVSTDSLLIIFWILISTFLSDTGGYIFGKIFKGKKLIKISPNKTYSGAIGSIILSCLSLPLMNFFQIYILKNQLINFFGTNFLIITLFLSLVCQSGDIFVSYLKRKINIKNISNILPGHGGILDRIDGLIFVLIYCLALKFFAVI